MDDAVRHDNIERRVVMRQAFSIDPFEIDAGDAGAFDVAATDDQHFFREIDSRDVPAEIATRQFDGDLCRPGADVEHLDAFRYVRHGAQQIIDEETIDRRVIHRVVVSRFLSGVHHFGFEHAGNHVRLRLISDTAVHTPSRIAPAAQNGRHCSSYQATAEQKRRPASPYLSSLVMGRWISASWSQ